MAATGWFQRDKTKAQVEKVEAEAGLLQAQVTASWIANIKNLQVDVRELRTALSDLQHKHNNCEQKTILLERELERVNVRLDECEKRRVA